MSRHIFDALGRVPPSPTLAGTLQRAADYARHQSHRRITLEHLLLALCDDPDAGRVLAASRVDVRQIMIDTSGFVSRIDDRGAPNQPVEPTLDPELMRILEYATLAAQQSGRREITGAIVLAAIVGDERSPAATILRSQGLTFDEAISFLRQVTNAPSEAQPAAVPPQFPEQAGAWTPSHDYAAAPPGAGPQYAAAQPPGWQQAASAPGDQPGWPYGAPPESADRPGYRPQGFPQAAAMPPGSQPLGYPSAPPQGYGPAGSAEPSAAYGNTVNGYAPRQQPQQPVQHEAPAQSTSRRTRAPARTVEPPPVLPLTVVDPDQLATMLPEDVTCEVPEPVEVHVARADLANLGIALGSGAGALRPEQIVVRTLTLRLRSPDGRLTVEAVTPETQWIDRQDAFIAADDLSWRWTVTGRRAGRAALVLSVAARTIGIDSIPIDSALPDQTHDVLVTVNWLRVMGRALALAGVAAAAVVLTLSGSLILDLLLATLRRG